MIRFRRIGDDTWQREGWRTDVPTNLYGQFPDVIAVRWQTPDGAACIIPIGELRRALDDARPRGGDGKKFLFRIRPDRKAIQLDGRDDLLQVDMEVLNGPGPNGDDPPRLRRGWGIRESEWHRETVARIGGDSSLVGVERNRLVQSWVNSCRSSDNEWFWHVLRTYKRPDVVFGLRNPAEIILIEVEPRITLADGVAQLAGDYLVSVQIDRELANEEVKVTPFLVSDVALAELPEQIQKQIDLRKLRFLEFKEIRLRVPEQEPSQ